MSELKFPLKDRLRDPADEAAVSRMWQAIDARFPRRRSRRSLSSVFAPLVGRRGGRRGGGVPAPRSGPAAPRERRRDRRGRRAAGGPRVVLSDGSSIELAPGARFEPIESSASSFIAVLERGTASFDVHPGGPRRWQIECGLATVEVVGTRSAARAAPIGCTWASSAASCWCAASGSPTACAGCPRASRWSARRDGAGRGRRPPATARSSRRRPRRPWPEAAGNAGTTQAPAHGRAELARAGAQRAAPRGVRGAGHAGHPARGEAPRHRAICSRSPTWRASPATRPRRSRRSSASSTASPPIRRRRWPRSRSAACSSTTSNQPRAAAAAFSRALELGAPRSLRDAVRPVSTEAQFAHSLSDDAR